MEIFEKIYNPISISIVGIVLMILIMFKHIHIIQLNSYNLDQQIIWYKRNVKSYLVNIVLLIAIIIVPLLFFLLYHSFGFAMQSGSNSTAPFWLIALLLFLTLLLVPLVLLVILIENLPRKQKKKLVFTKRIIRLIVIILFIYTLWFAIAFRFSYFVTIWIALLGVAICHLLIFIAYIISLPIENAIRKKFMNEAHEIVKANDSLYVVGITGSFGKTSVKYFLSKILKEKYSVCMTPESFNTPMGATLTIKNDLKNIDDIFICEMGARRVGDIKEICDIVNPCGAIITDVGNMHLDTFKTIENVRDTKFELVDSAYNNDNENKLGKGIILLNGDNEIIREKAKEYMSGNKEVYFYGLNECNDFYATDISVSEKGTSFKFNSKNGICEKEIFETKLLGKYNIINLVAAISYALLLNVDASDIKSAVRNIEAVPHRLQILPYRNNDLLIDDAYNSNPKGARNAIDVLSSFDNYVKVLITPGMVELNDRQEIENEAFAEYAGKLVDYAIIVGNTNKSALNKGLVKNLSEDKLINVDKVEVAIAYALQNISGKKVILLENDLSDNY